MFDSISNIFTGKKKDVQDGSCEQVNSQQFSPTESTSSQKLDAALPKNKIKESPKQVNVNVESNVNKPKHIADCETMTTKQLKLTYKREYSSWRGRKSWAKKNKVLFSPDFESFADFLSHHGPKPDPAWTLDRIDNSKGYVPGNTRWASKATQAENRKNVSHHKIAGDEISQPAIAHALGLSPDALRKRLARGGSVLDIIAEFTGSNKQGKPNPKKPLWEWPWPDEFANELEITYQELGEASEHRHHFFVRYCQLMVERLRNEFGGQFDLTKSERDNCIFWNNMLKVALATRERAIQEYRNRGAFRLSPETLRLRAEFSGIPSNTTDEDLRTD